MNSKREIISYLFFGVLATIVNVVFYYAFGLVIGENAYLINNILSWIITVVFAFVTNKIWVFQSKSWTFSVVREEVIGFFSARLFSLLLEEVGLYLLIELLKMNRLELDFFFFNITGTLLAKLIMQVIVILTNYFFSKFLIFKKKFQLGIGVCEGFARTVQLFCNRLEIPCITVLGRGRPQEAPENGQRHAWNLIRIDRVWRYYDFTYDLTASGGRWDCRRYYAMSEDACLATHGPSQYPLPVLGGAE